MDVHIDWLSWTATERIAPKSVAQLYDNARLAVNEQLHGYEQLLFTGQGFDASGSRPPYRLAISRNDSGLRVFGSSHTDTTLFELSGRGCDAIREHEVGREVVGCIADRITRIDFAADIRTDARPPEFSNDRLHNRFRHIGYVKSKSGETCYVGSPKSDRFCRVYRYDHPHPRSQLLRVEFVFRRGLARATARDYNRSENTQDFIARLGNTWGFQHSCWRPAAATEDRIQSPVTTRHDSDTVSWLYAQVAPAMRRLIASGALDVADFLDFVYNQ